MAAPNDDHAAPDWNIHQVYLTNAGNVIDRVMHSFGLFLVQARIVYVVVPEAEKNGVEILLKQCYLCVRNNL